MMMTSEVIFMHSMDQDQFLNNVKSEEANHQSDHRTDRRNV